MYLTYVLYAVSYFCLQNQKMVFFESLQEKDCLKNWDNPNEEDHRPVHFACKKASLCGKTDEINFKIEYYL